MSTTALDVAEEVERILRVDHAGEYGAVRIYQAQEFVSRFLYPDIAPKLAEMLEHERVHLRTFGDLMENRGIRYCYSLSLWSFGGACLGLVTGLMGRNAIWVCTTSIETTVLNHLAWQLDFLSTHDKEAYDAVLSIKKDEIEHRDVGQTSATNSRAYQPLYWIVSRTTELAIWLSTKL